MTGHPEAKYYAEMLRNTKTRFSQASSLLYSKAETRFNTHRCPRPPPAPAAWFKRPNRKCPGINAETTPTTPSGALPIES